MDGIPVRLTVAIALAIVPAVSSCRSLAIDSDLDQASETLEPRLGFAPGWSEEAREPDAFATPLTDEELPDSVDGAIQLAIQRHPEIRRALARVAERRADLVQAGLLPNPALRLMFGIPIDDGGGNPAMHSVMQDVAVLWKRPARVDAADAELRAEVLALCDATLALAAQVGAVLADHHHRECRLELAVAARRALEDVHTLVESRAAAGEATRMDVNRARLDLAAAREQEARDRSALVEARSRLAERLSVEMDDARRVATAVGDATLPVLEDSLPESPDLVALAIEQRLDVLAAYAVVEGADGRTRLAARERWPDLSVGAAYNRNFSDRDAIGPAVALTIPIFDTGRAALAKARAIERGSLAGADQILLDALLDVRIARARLDMALELRSVIEEDRLAPRSDDRSIAASTLEAGESTRVEFLQREAAWLAARRAHELATLEARVAYYELRRAAGGSLEPMEPTPLATRPREEDRS